MKNRTLRCLRVILLSYLAAACSVWSTHPVSRDATAAGPISHARVRALTADGAYELRDVSVDSDSLVGISESNGTRIALPMSSVYAIETRSISAGRTIGLVAVATVVAFGLLLAEFAAAIGKGG